MRKAVIMMAIAVLAGCGSNFEWFPSADKKPPTVTSFSFYADKGSLTVHVALAASDNEGVTGYLVTETATPPLATDGGWLPAAPPTYTFSGTTIKTLYAWARDAAGNISSGRSADLAYTLNDSIAFPFLPNSTIKVQSVSDISYDRIGRNYWLLASTSTSGTRPNVLVQMDASGQSLRSWLLPHPDVAAIDYGSWLVADGSGFWVSSSGKSEIYRFGSDGQYQATYPCPATTTGFCQGLAWDGTNLWAAGSDNRKLVSFRTQSVGGALPVANTYDYENVWSSNGVSDADYRASGAGQLLVLKDGLVTVNITDGSLVSDAIDPFRSRVFPLPGTGMGGWDGTYFWVVDNANSRLLRLSF